MADHDTIQERLSAYLDGELPAEEAREVEAWMEANPDALEDLDSLKGVGNVLRRAADQWDRDLDFEGFYDRVAARIEPRPVQKAPAEKRPGGFFGWLFSHPALAAAATALVVLGGGSLYYLNVPGNYRGPVPALEMRGGAAVIEDLSFESSSAVVYKTEADVTVIWLNEDGE